MSSISELMPPSLVIFDWDCTLVNSPGSTEAYDIERLRSHYSEQAPNVVEELPDYFWPFALPVLGLMPSSSFALPGGKEVLDHFYDAGVKVAVVSNKTWMILSEEVEWLGYGGSLCTVIGGAGKGRDKPEPDNLLAAADLCGADQSSIWAVGDTLVDMHAINKAGFVSIRYLYDGGDAYQDLYENNISDYIDRYASVMSSDLTIPQLTINSLYDLIAMHKSVIDRHDNQDFPVDSYCFDDVLVL